MNLASLLTYGKEHLKDYIDTYQLDARLLLEYVLNEDRVYILLHRDEVMSEDIITRYKLLIEKRKTNYPLQYILKAQWFMDLLFTVSEDVLIPRSDTENLVVEVIEKIKENKYKSCLDLCTGSGAIGISIKKYTQASVMLSDISDKALAIAKENASKNDVNVKIIKSDLFKNIEEKFDVIVSNPPYIPSEDIKGLQKEVLFEPHIALDGGVSGYDFYEEIINNANDYLNDKGLLAVEIGYNQGNYIKSLFLENGFIDIRVLKDLQGLSRVVLGKKG